MCWKAETLLCWQKFTCQGSGLSSGHVWLWEPDCKEGRTPKNWWLWTVVLEKTPESHLDSKEIKSVNLTGDQSWIFTGRADAEAEAPLFWPFYVNRWLIGKVPDAYWGQKKASEDEMAGQHHRCNEYELVQTVGDGEGQGGLAFCSPWGSRVGHNWVTEQQQSRDNCNMWISSSNPPKKI